MIYDVGMLSCGYPLFEGAQIRHSAPGCRLCTPIQPDVAFSRPNPSCRKGRRGKPWQTHIIVCGMSLNSWYRNALMHARRV